MLISPHERDALYALVANKETRPDIPNNQRALLRRLLENNNGITLDRDPSKPLNLLKHVAIEGTRDELNKLGDNLTHYFDEHPIARRSPYRFYLVHTETSDTYHLDIALNKPSPLAQRVKRSIRRTIQGRQPDTKLLTPEGEWPAIQVKHMTKTAEPPELPGIVVFMCHASGDKERVRDFHGMLKRRGCKPWLDEIDLIGGQYWNLEIQKAVRASDIVVVFLSNHSTTKSGYIQKEIRFALEVADEKPEGTIYIVPARLEECTIPDRLSKLHCIDLHKTNGFAKLVQSLLHKAKA